VASDDLRDALSVIFGLSELKEVNRHEVPRMHWVTGVTASHTLEATHIEFFSDEDEPEVDLGNITNSYTVPTTPNTRIHKDHPIDNMIGDVKSSVQTRRMTKPTSEQGFLSDVYELKTHDTLNTCLYACFLSQIKPTSIGKALSDSSCMEVITGVLKLMLLSIQFLLLVYINAAKLMLGSVNAVRHMLMLPVQVPAIEGDFINTLIQVDKKRVLITESSIRSDLYLDDEEGTDCLPTATIFEELTRMGYEKPSQKLTFYKAFFSPQWKYFIHTITQCLSAKSTAWNEFSSTMASLIICLATNKKFNLIFINQQLGDMSHHKKIFVTPFHTKKVFANMKRVVKDFSRRITPLFDTMMVQASKEVGEDSDHLTDSDQIPIIDQPSTFSQPKHKQKSKRRQRKEAEVPQDETEHEESIPTPSNDPQPSAKDAQAKEITALKKRVQRLERKKKSGTTGLRRLKKVGMSKRVESSEDQESLGNQEDASKQGRSIEDIDADAEVTLVNETQERQDDDLMFDTGVLDDDEVAASTIPTTVEETLAQTLIEIKAAKPKAKGIIFHDHEEQVSVFKPTVSVTQPLVKDKEKGIMQELERPLTKKDQVAIDEDLARNIQAQLDVEIIEEERIERQKQEEANIALIESWENT
ncbi:hypothetical protein Tco_1277148, partial [Tanacetum coccineum]